MGNHDSYSDLWLLKDFILRFVVLLSPGRFPVSITTGTGVLRYDQIA
ncbi:MAG: hypothetical protein ACRD1T_22330 [Acidimicrobiia bacterium]